MLIISKKNVIFVTPTWCKLSIILTCLSIINFSRRLNALERQKTSDQPQYCNLFLYCPKKLNASWLFSQLFFVSLLIINPNSCNQFLLILSNNVQRFWIFWEKKPLFFPATSIESGKMKNKVGEKFWNIKQTKTKMICQALRALGLYTTFINKTYSE